MDMGSTNIIISVLGTGLLGIIIYSLRSIKSDVKSVKDDVKDVKVEILSTVDKRFEQVDKRFDQVDKRFQQVDKRFQQVDERANEQAFTIRDILASIKALGVRIDTLECSVQEKFDELKKFQRTTQTELTDIKAKIASMETTVTHTRATVMNQSQQLTRLSEYSERIAKIEDTLNITPPHRTRTHQLEHAN